MKKYHPNLKVYLFIFLFLMFLPNFAHSHEPDEVSSFYQPLIQRLCQDGFDIELLSRLFTDFRAEMIPSVMRISRNSKEVPEIYSQFLNPDSISLSKKFLRHNLETLRQMENQFHIEKEIIVAILLVESRFGESIGKYRVMPTLASLALMDSPVNLWNNYLTLQEIDPEISYKWLESLAKKKANWAYHELKCFLRIIQQEKIDPLEVWGSYAGAFGMAQFIPSSYLNYALSKKGFGNWLQSKEDAIFSIGNYLKSHGWKKNLPIEKKREVLWYYNHSEPYVETILQVAQKIKNR